jgi:hypothetical protein
MTERLNEIGRYCGMEMNEKITKVTRISRPPFPKRIIQNWRMWNILTICVTR